MTAISMLSRTSSAPNATTGKRLANCSINWMPSWTSAPALKTRSAVISFHSPKDGLKQAWRGVCWMNPPYGSALPTWMAKAYASSLEGATVVCLVPARTDTRWWHDFAMRGEIRLIQGRLRFGQARFCAPFPSAIVVFRPKRYLSLAVNSRSR